MKLWVSILWCVLFGHSAEHCGKRTGGTSEPDDWVDWWECKRCKQDLSTLFDESTLIGRLKSWWYQE